MCETTKVYTPEQTMATTFALTPEQRRLCDVSFLLYCPNVKYAELQEKCKQGELLYFVWSNPGLPNRAKLVGSVHFPLVPALLAKDVNIESASTLISVRVYKNVTYVLFAPAFNFQAKGGVTTVYTRLTSLAENCLLTLKDLQIAMDMGVL